MFLHTLKLFQPSPNGSLDLGPDELSELLTLGTIFVHAANDNSSQIDGVKEGFEHGALKSKDRPGGDLVRA